jgi:Family of unknown function (DUF6064)
MQIVVYGLVLPVIALLFKPSMIADRCISATLAFMWAWTGAIYHWHFFSTINRIALAFGIAFIAQGAIYLVVGTLQHRLRFGYISGLRPVVGLALIIYAGMIYPVIGIGFGHAYPNIPLFGVTPCPVTIFTFGVFLLLRSPMKWWVIALPVLWSLIGGTAAFLLDVPQDWLLLVSGVATAALLVGIRPRLLE